jgi:hypothetical protein
MRWDYGRLMSATTQRGHKVTSGDDAHACILPAVARRLDGARPHRPSSAGKISTMNKFRAGRLDRLSFQHLEAL